MSKERRNLSGDKDKGANPGDDQREITFPICFGDFTVSDAERVKGLWEKTWSQDSRNKREDRKNKNKKNL